MFQVVAAIAVIATVWQYVSAGGHHGGGGGGGGGHGHAHSFAHFHGPVEGPDQVVHVAHGHGHGHGYGHGHAIDYVVSITHINTVVNVLIQNFKNNLEQIKYGEYSVTFLRFDLNFRHHSICSPLEILSQVTPRKDSGTIAIFLNSQEKLKLILAR